MRWRAGGVKLTGMADHVRLTLDLTADGDEPVGSLGPAGSGRTRRFWGWLELIGAVEEYIRQVNPDQVKPETGDREEGAPS
jgi:hypothetical protein